MKKSNINTELSSNVIIKTEPGDERCLTILGLAPEDHMRIVKPDPDSDDVMSRIEVMDGIQNVKIKKEPITDHDELSEDRLVRINGGFRA